MVTKSHIFDEIRRTAQANGGVPLGRKRFYAETGIKESDWLGKHWARWNDAVCEAGLEPNTLQAAFDAELLLEKLALLTRTSVDSQPARIFGSEPVVIPAFLTRRLLSVLGARLNWLRAWHSTVRLVRDTRM